MNRKRLLALLTVAFIATACSGDDDATGPSGGSNGDFKVSVSSGVNPNYSWTVGGAFSVSVVRTAAPTTIVWGIADPFNKNIASPAKHGTVPGGAVQSANAEPTLTAGTEYRVSVTLADGRTGWSEFRP